MSDVVDQLTERWATGLARPGSARTTPGTYRTLLRLLARGEPVTLARLAQAASQPEADIRQAIGSWPDTEYDEAGRVIGYGLTQRPTVHRFNVDGHRLYTWCALDTLFFPAVLECQARVESSCHATGAPIRLTVDPIAGVTDLDPAPAVVSLVSAEDDCASTRTAFCRQVHFFAHPDDAAPWLAEHPRAVILPVADAYRVAQPMANALLQNDNPATCRPVDAADQESTTASGQPTATGSS